MKTPIFWKTVFLEIFRPSLGMQLKFGHFQNVTKITNSRLLLGRQTLVETVGLDSGSDFIVNTFRDLC